LIEVNAWEEVQISSSTTGWEYRKTSEPEEKEISVFHLLAKKNYEKSFPKKKKSGGIPKSHVEVKGLLISEGADGCLKVSRVNAIGCMWDQLLGRGGRDARIEMTTEQLPRWPAPRERESSRTP